MATKQKAISRSLILSKKFWNLTDDSTRLFFLLTLLTLDNVGRGRGGKDYLKGKLYEKAPHISADDCERFLLDCHEKGILLRYEIDGVIHIQDPVHAEHNKIVGHMKAESRYPEPPQEVTEKYEQRFTKLNFVKQSLREREREEEEEREEEGEELLRTKQQIRQLCEKNLSRMATDSQVKNVMGRVNPKMRWVVCQWLERRYPETPADRFSKVQKELIR